jgi:ubiquinone/menaquinone biosynthesis C-methylase UbiE
VDIEKHPNVDFVCDISNLAGVVGGGTVDEIISSHVLEHFPHYRTNEVLLEWKRVLKDDGIMWLSVPDFDRAVDIYSRYGLSEFLRNFLWGDQTCGGAFHQTGFDEASLRAELEKAGMTCERVAKFPFTIDGCDENIFNLDKRHLSLRVRAMKKCPY